MSIGIAIFGGPRDGRRVQVNKPGHPKHGMTGVIHEGMRLGGMVVYDVLLDNYDILTIQQEFLQPDAHNRECDQPASWRSCAWKPKGYR